MDVCKHQENLKKEFYDQRVSQNSDQFNQNLSLGLRFMNLALKQTAFRHHDYDENKLRTQGTTPMHVIYSRISMFDCFLQVVVQIALSPDTQS